MEIDSSEDDRILRLNVEGTHYDVSPSFLLSEAPDTMLSSICSENWKGGRTLDESGSYLYRSKRQPVPVYSRLFALRILCLSVRG